MDSICVRGIDAVNFMPPRLPADDAAIPAFCSWQHNCMQRAALIRRRLNSGVTERTPMSKLSTHELELAIQLSLVAKVKEAAQRYMAEPAESASSAQQAYISALECLAEHIEAKCHESRLFKTTALPVDRLRARNSLSETAKPRTGHRVIPFPAVRGAGGSPLTAA
jgi:hypothetical protein